MKRKHAGGLSQLHCFASHGWRKAQRFPWLVVAAPPYLPFRSPLPRPDRLKTGEKFLLYRWRLHLSSPPAKVYPFLATADGRARFWAKSATESGDVITFNFSNGLVAQGRILEQTPPHRFVVEYLGGTVVTFTLAADGRGGTDLTLTDSGVGAEWYAETLAGWVSVLLALKAAVDFGVDLRNHDAGRTWDQGYCDN
jgi:uncharacterized protein YndB with AHSA1/START domain